MKRNISGFTIVELLIVIVVIAILAAISIVAYTGIQERARVSNAAAFASQLKKRDLVDGQGYWNFDECSGSTANNTSGSGTGGSSTLSGTTSFSNDTPSGSGCSVTFTPGSYITTNVPLSNTYYMKSIWFKTSSASVAMNLISDANAGNTGTAFYISNGKLSSGHNGNWGAVQSDQTVNDGKWHHGAVEFTQNSSGTNGTLKLYLDGNLIKTHTSVPLITAPSDPASIGAHGTGSTFIGQLDDPMIIYK